MEPVESGETGWGARSDGWRTSSSGQAHVLAQRARDLSSDRLQHIGCRRDGRQVRECLWNPVGLL